MGDKLIICRMKKFRPRQLRVGSVSRKRGKTVLAPRRGARAKYWPRLELNFQWTPCPPRVVPQVIMSSSRRSDKEVATSSPKKRSRSGNVPLAPAVPDNLAREFPQILRRIRELGMKFVFAEPEEFNLHMIREFYAN
ncbi:hypothetical protein KY290_021018 [Solanum tuberosum]|uniref:Uncharacterized protein n=1 Tax=Solanum tuberosum TaxID=4113 RepID=A0ABQ7V3F2_SOLTU|nr:hypothetical protein KY289_020204 [Solanum tuberosum]KAH0692866.1 hypothetical protein KY285_019963 [Solanum tuberosum]KAH0757525.1 hypothetical protein KY290_021018 [Solanum tuberosum]